MKKTDPHVRKTETVQAAPGTADTATQAVSETTPEQLIELRARAAKADEYWDRLLRTAADFENFKKRAARERHEIAQSAAAALIQKLLPVLDHFEMAQAAAQTTQGDKLAALQNGVAMIQQQLKSTLTEAGLEEVDANGRTFDPTLHEAVSQLETHDTPEGQVVQQFRNGYKVRNRFGRRAAGVVAQKKPTPPAA